MTHKEVDSSYNIKSVFEKQPSQLSNWFEYTLKKRKFTWVQELFRVKALSHITSAEENLTELSCKNTLKTKNLNLSIFAFHRYKLLIYIAIFSVGKQIPD